MRAAKQRVGAVMCANSASIVVKPSHSLDVLVFSNLGFIGAG
jgi:hypothetical protein